MDNRWNAGWLRVLAACAFVVLQAIAHAAPPDWATLSGGDIVPGELIVVYRDEAVSGGGRAIGLKRRWIGGQTPAAVSRVHGRLQARVKSRFQFVPAEVVSLPADTDLAAAAALYAGQPEVAAVYPNRRYYPSAYTPDDPLWPQLWGMRMVRADEAWELHPVMNTATVVVAVIDSGILRTHPDLKDIIWTNPGETGLDTNGVDKAANGVDDDDNGYIDDVNGWDFWEDDNDPSDAIGHGTHVAGTIGAIRDNGVGVAGFSPAIRILPVRGLGAYGTSESLGHAIEYVALMSQYVKLSNNSWGGAGDDAVISDAINVSRAAGQLFVAAAGNDHQNIDLSMSHPGGMPHDNIVCVAAVNEKDAISDFSNFGIENVDIAAPGGTSVPNTGRQIVSAWHVPVGTNGLYNGISGTSMASPHVAGAAAYLWALRPHATYAEIATALYDGAVVRPGLVGLVAGGRRLDLEGAIGALAFAPFATSRFYGHPAAGFPLSAGGLASNVLSSVWQNTCTVDVACAGDPDVWLTVESAPTTLAAGEEAPLVVRIDPGAPGFPTVPGVYSNTVTVTFTPETAPPLVVTRTIHLRLSKTYFLQSAPYAWAEDATNTLASAQLSGAALPLPAGLTFTYYNQVYSNLYVYPNGIVLFEPPAVEADRANSRLPDARTGAAGLFPNWMPTALADGSVAYGATVIDARPAFVVTWNHVAHLSDTSVRYDYQVVLFDTGADECSEIRFQYLRVAQDSDGYGMGRDATVGLQSDGAYLAFHYAVDGAWRPAPGSEYDPCSGWVDGRPMDLADGQALRWTWGARLPDTVPPTATITPIAFSLDDIRYEVRFNEIVFDLTTSDFGLGAAIPGLTVASVAGGGERFIVALDNAAERYGAVSLWLNANSVYDLAMNWNNVPLVSPPRAIPYQETLLRDDFERGAGLWRASTNSGTTDFTSGGWEFGTPYPGVPGGPAAHSGANCWGTFLGSPAWTSANGYPNGWFPGGSAFAMQTQLDSPRVHVGASPTVRFWTYWDLKQATASVLAVPGGSGEPVLLGTITGSGLGAWRRRTYRLPATLANRELSIRIVVSSPYGVTGPGLYLDDFEVYSVKEPGVYFLEFTPNTVDVPVVSNLIGAVAYNTHTATVTHVEGVFAAPVAGVAVAPGTRVPFGTITVGGMATSMVACTVAPGTYPAARIPVQGNASIRGERDQISFPELFLNTPGEPYARHLVAVTGAAGVRDWLGRPLQGDGGDASAGYQILWIGANGVIDPPRVDGAPGGDDRALYSTGPGRPYERFGAVSVAADAGLFSRAFSHNLPAGALLYARAWDGPTFDQSVAYGDSALKPLATGLAGEVVDFGIWTVGTPFQPARDWNGDGIPDGYAVNHPALGIDPRAWPDPDDDALRVLAVRTCTRSGFRPIRVELFRDRVYILYISNTGDRGVVEVRDLSLANLLQSVTHGAGTPNPLLNVSGLAIDRLNQKLYVSEYSTAFRVYRYVIAADGSLAYEATVAHARRPTDVAVGGDGRVYLADKQSTIKRYEPLMAGSPASIGYSYEGLIDRISVFGANAYRTFDDSVSQVHRVHRLGLPAGGMNAVFGLAQTVPQLHGPGYLSAPAKVCEGVSGWLYAADRSHHRLQLFDAAGGFLAMTPTGAPSPSTELGRFDLPTGICVTNDPFGDHAVYVADEQNERVQRLALMLDLDADGMDDAWERLHGLDDALLDNDGDGLPNLGEFRLRRDPNERDTDGDGLGDAFDLYEPILGTQPPQVTNLVATVAQDGGSVLITVWYDRSDPTNAPVFLGLAGGAYLDAASMTLDGASAEYVYIVQPGDAGKVTVVISGPYQDPSVYTVIDAFELAGPPPVSSATLDALVATPGVVGASANVLVRATFSGPVGDAAVTIAPTDGGVPLAADVAMLPLSAAPDTVWIQAQAIPAVPTNRWFVVSVASSALPGTSPRRAGFAVIDPRITAFAMPPPAVTWSALTGVLYRIESRDDLLAGAWQTVLTTNRPGPVELGPLTAWPPDVPPVGRRFFRVVAP